MAAGLLSAPGTPYGPCATRCAHIDCGQTRQMAATTCVLCDQPIGYDTRFYDDREYGLVHAACLEESLEAQRALREAFAWLNAQPERDQPEIAERESRYGRRVS